MGAAVKIKEHDRSIGGDKSVAHRVVCTPDLHVGAVGGIADIEWVAEDDRGVVEAL